MIANLAAVAAAAFSVMLLDAVWLGWLMKDFVRERIGPLMLDTPRFGIAALFYLLYGVAVLVFVVRPAADPASFARAATLGALLGFFCYMTYDLSNLATLKNWSAQFAIVDMLWGTFVTVVAGQAGLAAYRAVNG